MCSSVRTRLGFPRAQTPNDAQLLNQICTELRIVKRHQSNTSNPWNLNDYIVDVQPNEGTYLIAASDFGVPLAVLSWAPDVPTWIARLIPIMQPQNMVFDYAQPNNAALYYAAWDGSNCTATRCAFYRRNNLAYIEFLPVPQQIASYKIRFLQSGNNINQMSLSESPVTNEDADIVEVRTALALLSTTEWQANDNKDGRAANAEKRKDLFTTLTVSERELRRQFDAAQLQTQGDRLTMRYNPTVG